MPQSTPFFRPNIPSTTTAATATTNSTDWTDTMKSPTTRITLMVNIWINHYPYNVELLPNRVVDELLSPFTRGTTNTPPFYWNTNVTTPHNDTTTSTTQPDRTVLEVPVPNHVIAGMEETVLCNQTVSMTYDTALMEALQASHSRCNNNNNNSTATSTMELNVHSDIIQLQLKDANKKRKPRQKK
jgi:hypothetical protein